MAVFLLMEKIILPPFAIVIVLSNFAQSIIEKSV